MAERPEDFPEWGEVFGLLTPRMRAAVADFHAGLTVESAAARHGLEATDLEWALLQPDAREVEPTAEWTAENLLASDFRPVTDILPGIIPTGLVLLSAAPKVGKTRFLVQLTVACAGGGQLLGLPVTTTPVLTLALEDGARRIRLSLQALVGPIWGNRKLVTIRTTSLRLDEGGLAAIAEFLDEYPDCRLVVIDVLERVRPHGRGSNAYRLDYQALAPLQRLATIRGITIVVVHHANQRAEVSDTFERVSGTSGLTGVVDGLLLLSRRNGDTVGTLAVSGREVESRVICLAFTEGWWGPAPEGMTPEVLALHRDVRDLWEYLAANPGASTAELAQVYGRTDSATLKVLRRLEEEGLVDALGAPAPGRPVLWQVVVRP